SLALPREPTPPPPRCVVMPVGRKPTGKVGRVMRWARVFFLLLLGALTAACQVDADVLVQMRDDGSGAVTVTVTLDPEAAARIPDLTDQLQVDDLEAVGWRVDGPSTVEGG